MKKLLKTFLKQYLPRNLEMSTGLAVDAKGGVSKQLDIIIHDAAKTPVFFQSTDTRVIPIECIYAVIEVKSCLDKSELEKSFQNMQSVKTLEKIAFFEPDNPIIIKTTELFGKKWSNWPVLYFVFAFDSSTSLESILSNLQDLVINTAVDKRIDSICVLSKGVILKS